MLTQHGWVNILTPKMASKLEVPMLRLVGCFQMARKAFDVLVRNSAIVIGLLWGLLNTPTLFNYFIS